MKKGQVPTNPQSYAALLIFVIGLTLIIYILMLPPSDRADLLEENRTTAGDGKKDQITILMTKEPGTLSNIADTEIIKDLPAFSLYSRTDTESLIDSISVGARKSLFEEKIGNISFIIDDFKNTNNYLLSFTVPKRRGELTILLNDQIVSIAEYTTDSPSPIKLPKDWLRENNNIVFKVSGPGIEFWRANEYLVQGLRITADVTDTSGVENKQVFVLTEQEKANLQAFELSFVADCKTTDVSPIDIYLNKRRIYYSVPDCGQPIKVAQQDATRLKEGENDLLFRAEKGFYEVYSVEATLMLKKPLYPTYYFYIEKEKFDEIEKDTADINITMLFTEDENEKKGTVLINGIKREINSPDQDFNWKVNDYVRQGNNAIEIQPKSEKLNILEIKVLLVE
jgi:hypothetical protein